ncbi:carbohydrate binding domain-containing protein, partial [Duffyella gerundensis]
EANALVMIEFGRPGEPYSTGYTAIANARGEWSFTPPDTLGLGEWVFRAKAGNGSSYSNSWSLTVTEGEVNTSLYDFEKIAHQTITGSWQYDHLTFTLLTPANVSLSVENASAYGNSSTAMKLVTSGSATNSYVRLKVDFEVMVNFVQLDALDWEGKDSFVAFFNSRGEEIGRVYAEDIRSNIQQQLRFYTEKNEIAYMELNLKSSTVDFLIDNIIIQESYNPLENIDSGFAPFDINKFSASQVGTYEFEDGLKMVIQNNPGNGVISNTANGLLMRENATQEFRFGATDKVQFDIVQLNNTTDHKIEIHSITGEIIHAQTMDRNGTYYFEAPKGTLISHIVFTNGTEAGTDTGYYLDNLTWGNNITSKLLHHWTFDNNTLEGWTLAGDYAKTNSGNNVSSGRVNLKTDSVGGNTYSGQVMYYDVVVEKGKTYDFSFKATRVTTNYGHPQLGMTVGDIAVIPATTIVSGSYDLTGSWTATESGTVRVAVTNNTATGAGNDFYLDNIKMNERFPEHSFKEQTANGVDEASAFTFINSVDELQVINGGDGVDTLVITGAQQTLVLSDVADKLNSVEVIDITGNGDNRLELNAGDILNHGGRDLFIDDGKLQFMVQGNEGDTVQLDDLLPDGTDTGDWIAQNGTVTVAGVEYQVFSHSGEEAEVLIQQGIKTELI